MAQKQQALINFLNKYVQQSFLFKRKKRARTPKVRLRNEVHCLEDEDRDTRNAKRMERIRNDTIGLLSTQCKPYEPVAGWPELGLDELVIRALGDQVEDMDKMLEVVHSHFAKTEVKRQASDRREEEQALKDMSDVHKFSAAGFCRIKSQLAESEARLSNVKAGSSFRDHFTRSRHKREEMLRAKQGSNLLRKFAMDQDYLRAKERVRKDTILYLETVKDLLDKLMLLKLRHLKSSTPINLALLGKERGTHKIMAEAPFGWPGFKLPALRDSMRTGRCGRSVSRVSSQVSRTGSAASLMDKKGYRQHQGGTDPGWKQRSGSAANSERESVTARRMFPDQEMIDTFRKRWPPVWMSLAALEQGYNITDPECPTREYSHRDTNPNKGPKSLFRIRDTRKEWAEMRRMLDKRVEENLWREDMEKLSFHEAQYDALAHIPIASAYPNYQKTITRLLADIRKQRQQVVIYDCELTEWYKTLVEEVQSETGKNDSEINTLLQDIKPHFHMSASYPKYCRAKLALITMSLPATQLLQLHMQRAIRFILKYVLGSPETMLTGWMAARGFHVDA